MTDKQKILLGLGLLGLGVLVFIKRHALSNIASAALDSVNDELFRLSLPSRAQPYADVIKQASRDSGMDPFMLVALVEREDPMWNPNIVSNDPNGGHGYGLTQITSDKSWIASADWSDPYTNLMKGAEMLNDELSFFSSQGLDEDSAAQAALAAYNHGRNAVWRNVQAMQAGQAGVSIDSGTTGGDYASDVWMKFQNLAGGFAASLGLI
jgi:membrane-bound lytic murein transglycosylase MltF